MMSSEHNVSVSTNGLCLVISGTQMCVPLAFCTFERLLGARAVLQCTSVASSVCKFVQFNCPAFVSHLLIGCIGLDANAILYVSLS